MERPPAVTRDFGLALAAAALFGLSVPLAKILTARLDPLFLAGLFYLGGGLFVLPASLREARREIDHLARDRRDGRRILGAVLFGGVLGPVALLYGVKLTTAGTSSLLMNLETVATSFLAWLVFGEHLGRRTAAAAALTVLAGAMLVVTPDLSLDPGGLLIALACLCWGFDNNYTATVEGVSPATNTLIKGIVAGAFNILAAAALGKAAWDPSWILGALAVGGFAYGLSIQLYIAAARRIGAARSQVIFSANPFIGFAASLLILGEPFGPRVAAAGAVMVAAIALLARESHVHEHRHDAEEHEHEHAHDDGHHEHAHEGIPRPARHTHRHAHAALAHAHPHYPDLHHRHEH